VTRLRLASAWQASDEPAGAGKEKGARQCAH